MLKVIRLAAAGVFASTAAIAGSVAYVAPVVPEIIEEEAGTMGGSGLWLIPLLAIALIFLTLSSDEPSNYS